MNAAESLVLTRMVKAACPQQKFDEYTPDAWFRLLNDLRFADCDEAIISLGKRQTFISPAEIRDEVRRTRSKRIESEVEQMPDCDPDDVAGYLAALREGRTKVADGTERVRPVGELLSGTAKRMPSIPSKDSK